MYSLERMHVSMFFYDLKHHTAFFDSMMFIIIHGGTRPALSTSQHTQTMNSPHTNRIISPHALTGRVGDR